MVEAVKNLSRGQRSQITMNIWFFKDAVICQISLYCSSELSSLQQSLHPPSLPYCLWVSDSSSLPVTARCLDFELALFTPLSVVVVVVIVVALRQNSRNGEPWLSLNWRLQRRGSGLVGYFQRKKSGRVDSLVVSHMGWKRNLVDLLAHICLVYPFYVVMTQI